MSNRLKIPYQFPFGYDDMRDESPHHWSRWHYLLHDSHQNVTLMIFPRLSSLALCNFSQSIDGFKISLLYWS